MGFSKFSVDAGISYRASLAVLLLILCLNAAMAGTTAFYGPKFDRHLVVKLVEEPSLTFRILAPATIEDRNVESAWLAFYERPFKGLDQPRLPVHYDEINLDRDGDKIVGEFRLAKLHPESFVTVRVHLDSMCEATAEMLVQPPQTD